MIKGLAHLCFHVRDLNQAIAFYVDALGLEHAFEFKNEKGGRFGVYLSFGGRVFLELFEGAHEPPEKKVSFQHFCIEVEDVKAAVESLRSKGIEVTEPQLGRDLSWQAWMADPDGNRIELHSYTPKSWQTEAMERLEQGKE